MLAVAIYGKESPVSVFMHCNMEATGWLYLMVNYMIFTVS